MDPLRPADKLVKRSLDLLKGDFVVVGKRRVSLFALSLFGMFMVGAVAAFGFLASRSGTLQGGFAAKQVGSEVQNLSATENSLVVDETSHIVVMEYMPWFGSQAVSFSTSPATPLLTSDSVSQGYDSSDRKVIRQHVQWIQALGVEALLVDFTNGLSCLTVSKKDCGGNAALVAYIQNNIATLYEEMDLIRKQNGSRLKIIPLIGAQEGSGLDRTSPEKSGTEIALEFFEGLVNLYPDLNVIYNGKPLVVTYHGAPQDINPVGNDWWRQTREFFEAKGFSGRLTLRQMAGFIDDQPHLRKPQSNQVREEFGFWTWIDRLKPGAPFYYEPSFVMHQNGKRVEAFTAATASPGRGKAVNMQAGLNPPCATIRGAEQCSWGNLQEKTPDAAFRERGNTFREYMKIASRLQPIFLFLTYWNGFAPPDDGWDEERAGDIEPTALWDFGPYQVVKEEIQKYKANIGDSIGFSIRGFVGTDAGTLIQGFTIQGSEPLPIFIRAQGPSLPPDVGDRIKNPSIVLFKDGSVIASNDDHSLTTSALPLLNALRPQDPKESALAMDLAPGSYTIHLVSADKDKGVGLVELFDIKRYLGELPPDARLVNVSGRGLVGRGGEQMIGGLIKQAGSRSFLIRGRGKSMNASFSTIKDPLFSIFKGQTKIGGNDDFMQQDKSIIQRMRDGLAGNMINGMSKKESATIVALHDTETQAYTAILEDKKASFSSCKDRRLSTICRVGILEFFDLEAFESTSPQSVPITVSLKNPSANAVLNGAVDIDVTLAGNQGETTVVYAITNPELIFDPNGLVAGISNVTNPGDIILGRSKDSTVSRHFLWDTNKVTIPGSPTSFLRNLPYALKVIAYDDAGHYGSVSVPIRLDNDRVPPTVLLEVSPRILGSQYLFTPRTTPVPGAPVFRDQATIVAEASDNQNALKHVDFKLIEIEWRRVGLTSLPFSVTRAENRDTGSPFTFELDTATLLNGTYQMQAVASDMNGNMSSPDSLIITVQNP